MKRIVVDIGNTALKWDYIYEVPHPRAFVHSSETTLNPDVIRSWEEEDVTEILGTYVCRPELKDQIESFMEGRGGKCTWLRTEAEFKGPFYLLNSYEYPERLGADRWYGAVGAIALNPQKSIVLVQFGTATTVDMIRYEGGKNYVFEGGMILPGLNLMYTALERKIPAIAVPRGAARDFPKNTSDAINTGIVDAQLGPVYFAIQRLKKTAMSNDIEVILTGGAASILEKSALGRLPCFTLCHNIVLTGIKLRAEPATCNNLKSM